MHIFQCILWGGSGLVAMEIIQPEHCGKRKKQSKLPNGEHLLIQGGTGHGKPGKSWNSIIYFIFQAWKVMEFRCGPWKISMPSISERQC